MSENNTTEFDAVLVKMEQSPSNLQFFRDTTPIEKSVLDNTSLAANSTGSANDLIRSLDPAVFQRLDYGRDIPYNIAQEQDCIKRCVMRNNANNNDKFYYYGNDTWDNTNAQLAMCIQQCITDTRKDYV